MGWWRENVVEPIHKARFPLPKILGVHGSTYMQFVYFSAVMGGGMLIMNWAIHQSEKNIGVNGEKLRHRTDLGSNGATQQNNALGLFLQKLSPKN